MTGVFPFTKGQWRRKAFACHDVTSTCICFCCVYSPVKMTLHLTSLPICITIASLALWHRMFAPMSAKLSWRIWMKLTWNQTTTKHTFQWRHNERDGVSNHQPHDCLLNRLFRHRSKETSKLRVTGLCEGNSPVTGEFIAQRASNAENVSICWRHHAPKRTIRQFLGCTVYADTLRSPMQWCLKGPHWIWIIKRLFKLPQTDVRMACVVA